MNRTRSATRCRSRNGIFREQGKKKKLPGENDSLVVTSSFAEIPVVTACPLNEKLRDLTGLNYYELKANSCRKLWADAPSSYRSS